MEEEEDDETTGWTLQDGKQAGDGCLRFLAGALAVMSATILNALLFFSQNETEWHHIWIALSFLIFFITWDALMVKSRGEPSVMKHALVYLAIVSLSSWGLICLLTAIVNSMCSWVKL